jgi:hypothetical protein
MKKLLFALCALAAIALLTPSAGFAQWENRIGIYTSAAAADVSINPAPAIGTNFFIYFVLTNPTEAGAPMTFVKGFEFKVSIVGGASADFLRNLETYPTPGINIGDVSDFYNSTYLCGYGSPVPVVDGKVLLLTWRARIYDDTDPYNFYLSPADPASFPGHLAFLNSSNVPLQADGSQPLYTDPVFTVGGVPDPVATESASFGGVKALFR